MRYFLQVQYYGPAFHGSQLQGTTATVQLELNKAISVLLKKETLTFGASRTDKGVHANCNFYHFDSDLTLDQKFKYQLNALLPFEIAVDQLYESNSKEANSRFDAVSRRYRYRIYQKKNPFLQKRAWYYPYQLNLEMLHQTAEILKKYHHFESFSKKNTQSKTFQCTIFDSYWETHGEELHYVVEANRFLRGMVRALVATQLQVARNKLSIADFKHIIESNDCTKADFSAEGHGLYLENIAYPPKYFK